MCLTLFLTVQFVWADGEKVNFEFRTENYRPQETGTHSFTKQAFVGDWGRDDKGLGLTIENIPEIDWLRLESHGFLDFGNFRAILGYRQDDRGGEKLKFLFPGIKFWGKKLGFNYCFVFRNFFSLDREESFFDSIAFVGHPVTEKFSLGMFFLQDHYWNDELASGESESHDYLLASVVGRYQINEHYATRLRIARSWDSRGGDSYICNQFRFTMEFHY